MYKVRFTERFLRAIKKEHKQTLEDALREIEANPYHARGSHPLSYEWAGFRGADYVGAKRIIYRICEECFRQKQQITNPLDCCAVMEMPGETITFVDFGDYHASAGKRRIRPANSYPVRQPEEEETTENSENTTE